MGFLQRQNTEYYCSDMSNLANPGRYQYEHLAAGCSVEGEIHLGVK